MTPRMVRMRTLIPHNYGKRLTPAKVGEEFECEEGHVKVLLHTRVAEVIEESKPSDPPGGYSTRVMEAITPTVKARRKRKSEETK